MRSLNVGTMEGKAWEVVEIMKRLEDGRTVCTGDEVERRQGTEAGVPDTRCCTRDDTEGVMVLVSS